MGETFFRYGLIATGVVLMFVFDARFKKAGNPPLKAWLKGFGLSMAFIFVVALLSFALVFK